MNAHVCVCVNVGMYICVYVEWCLRERGREICVDKEMHFLVLQRQKS